MGKLFTVLYLFVGIGLILVFINAVAQRMLEIQGDRRPQKPRDEDDKGRSCP